MSLCLTRSSTRTLTLDNASPATRLLEKRRQMFEVQEALEAQKQEFAKKVRVCRCGPAAATASFMHLLGHAPTWLLHTGLHRHLSASGYTRGRFPEQEVWLCYHASC